ncbi:MAG: hypothetical protein A3E87_10785 [Gammaproteobacteria bacterium RIFCSPHIGHO2_12_FULL_35_23]|nr:MAG: hypothetical protein A3E87_10785 [Gammaproteobacteria bacterium RIFCSPHIGHO2_12_FULL_35_23]
MQDWEIVHIKHLRKQENSPIFNASSEFSDFVPNFEPRAGEIVITKNLYSCYSANDFLTFMEKHHQNNIDLIGYNSIMYCLSTVIEGIIWDHKMTLIEDASFVKSTSEFDEVDMHRHRINPIKAARYAEISGCF